MRHVRPVNGAYRLRRYLLAILCVHHENRLISLQYLLLLYLQLLLAFPLFACKPLAHIRRALLNASKQGLIRA